MSRAPIREDMVIADTYIFAWSSALFRFYKDWQCEGLKTWERTASTAPRFFCIHTSAPRLPTRTKKQPNRLKGRRHNNTN